MDYSGELKEKLKKYRKEDIIITEHAYIRAVRRQISLDEVRENIINPTRLSYAVKQEAKNEYEEKYDCYFGYSKTLCHRYVIAINHKCIVCTIIKINRRWQRRFEKHAKV
ncbi:MAG: hypothetical protein QME12_00400 [Nanoarchaeota archaeon]|nr:hypothetical protein [Nanoarchaeota archaeon]